MNCNICGKELDVQNKPISYIGKALKYDIKFYCKSCTLKRKVHNEIVAQKFDLIINRISQNNKRIIALTQISKTEGIQLVIDYLYKENKNLLEFIK